MSIDLLPKADIIEVLHNERGITAIRYICPICNSSCRLVVNSETKLVDEVKRCIPLRDGVSRYYRVLLEIPGFEESQIGKCTGIW